MIKQKLIWQPISMLWLFIIIGCVPSDKTPLSNSNIVEISPNSPNVVSTSLPITRSLPTTPTATFAPSKTPTSESIPSIQPTETSTILPTLQPNEAEALVLELFETNGGCQLPCWWGFTPGETNWVQAKTFLQTFVEEIDEPANSPAFQSIDVYISPPPDEESLQLRHYYEVQDGVIELIDVIIPEDISAYQLASILNSYGKPSLIFLLTGNQVWLGSLPFSVILFYPQYSLLFHYNGQATVQGNMVQICMKDTTIRLAVWSPQLDLAYSEAAEGTLHLRPSPYELPLEEATGMTVTSFYETFKNPENEACLETPAELWPNP